MSLFDSASLVVTPNGYKEDKLYSVIPTNGSGDLSVTRATTATRVNSAGLVELVPYNFIQYSQNGTLSPWNTNATLNANSALAPDGTMTATRVQLASGGNYYLYQGIGLIGSVTISCYIKGATAQTIGFSDGSANTNSINITTEWVRYTFTYNSSVGSGIQFDNYFGISPTQQAKDFYIWGMQLVSGTSAKDYFPTTDRLNVPRLDYTGSTCPSILVEPQRTNTILQSEDLATSWTSFRSVVTTNITNSPSGISNADKVAQQSGNVDAGGVYQTISLTNGTTYTYSFYAKAAGYNWTFARVIDGGTNYYVWFNLATGVVGTIQGSATAKIQNAGNGWYRCSVTFTSTGTGNQVVNYVANADNSDQMPSPDSVKGIYLWGTQLEAGSYPTSYIPTVASSVTRNADVISKTGISSLIGQTEGTIYFEYFNTNGLQTIPFRLNGSDGKFIWIRGTGAMFFGNGTTLLFNDWTIPTANQLYKIAFVYGQNDFKLYINGSLSSAVTSGTFTGTFDDIQIPALPNEDPFGQQIFIKTVALWKSKLTNTELATLTTI